jgi:hypothetical protein
LLEVLFGSGTWVRTLHILAVAILGGAAIAEYTSTRDTINARVGMEIMPAHFTQWALLVLVASVALRLAHNEAMRRLRAANIIFGTPYVDESPLFKTVLVMGAHQAIPVKEKVHDFYAAKIEVFNKPYKGDEGKDVVDAWSTFELFDLNSKLTAKWRDGRWEDNKQPGYADHPTDHIPDEQKVRTLSANGRPNILCIVIKPVADADAYPFRAVDQLQPDWRAKDITIPPGDFFLRLTIGGKGLINPVQRIFKFRNNGAGKPIELLETSKSLSSVETFWSRDT